MIAVRADCTTPLCTTLYKTAANATAAIVPTAYSAVVMPASSRTSCRTFLIMSATSRQQFRSDLRTCAASTRPSQPLTWLRRWACGTTVDKSPAVDARLDNARPHDARGVQPHRPEHRSAHRRHAQEAGCVD